MAPLQHPQVKFPPPLMLLAVVGFAMVLNLLIPLQWIASGFVVRLGQLLLVLAAANMAWSAYEFRRFKTTILPHKPSSAIIQSGPFRFSRNPIYLSFLFIQSGLGLLLGNIWLFLLLPVTVFLLTRRVIEKEEAFLMQTFGQEYQTYLQRVRRWL